MYCTANASVCYMMFRSLQDLDAALKMKFLQVLKLSLELQIFFTNGKLIWFAFWKNMLSY